MLTFLISATRAIVEMLGLCLIGQGMLYILAGRNRQNNRIYQLFDLITRGPRNWVGSVMPAASGTAIGLSSFAILFILWLGLALVRKFI